MATYTTPDMSRPWAPERALVCPDCGWDPPPYYRYGVAGRPNKTEWTRLYHQHRRVMHEPHSTGCDCVVCVERRA